MATDSKSDVPDFLTPAEQAAEADAAQWRTVSEEDIAETKIVFEVIGDEFIGTYLGWREVDGAEGKFIQYRFEANGQRYFTNAGWNLVQGMKSVSPGQQTRIRFINERDTGAASPMRIFQVDVARVKSSPASRR